MSVSNGPSIITSGLVLSLDAADKNSYPGSGTTWNDLSGNAYNGTLTNGPTFSSANQGSIVFDGSDDFVNLTNASTPITNKTYELFFRPTSIPAPDSFRSIWQKSANWNENTGISMQFIYNRFTFSYGASWGGSVALIPIASYITVNNWYHVVATVSGNGGSAIMYINGSIAGTGTAGTPTTTVDLTLGKGDAGSFLGDIPLFRCYNRALSAAEIVQNYSATKTRFGL